MEHADVAAWQRIEEETRSREAALVAISKKKPVSVIEELYALGQRDFGENYVQELLEKQQALPQDIRWHFTGHLQRNKVKQIVPFVWMIHSVDSLLLLEEIAKQSVNTGRVTKVLLQMHVAQEETKFGFDEAEVREALRRYAENSSMRNGVEICGLMGMASFTDDQEQVRREFRELKEYFDAFRKELFADPSPFRTLSMGMSGDYRLALEEGSNMVRIGSLLFGARN